LGGGSRTEGEDGVVSLGGGRKQRWRYVIFTKIWRRGRDEMEGKKISLSSHLRARYQIFSPAVDNSGHGETT